MRLLDRAYFPCEPSRCEGTNFFVRAWRSLNSLISTLSKRLELCGLEAIVEQVVWSLWALCERRNQDLHGLRS